MSSYNSTPGYTSKGWNDKSGGNPATVAQSLPQHLPMVPVLASRGDSVPTILAGSDLLAKHGDECLDVTSKYFTHSNLFLQGFNANANLALVKRFILPGAEKAAIGLAIEVIESEQTQYERNANGTYALDASGNKIEIDGAPKLAGFKARWVTYTLKSSDMGKAAVKAGSLTGDQGAVSKVYPIFEGVLPSEGEYGNLTGIRFFGPTNSDKSGTDEDFIRTYSQYLYRLQFVEAADSLSTPKPISTISGGTSVDFCLGRDVLDKSTQRIMSYDAQITASYLDQESTWNKPMPMDMEFYDENIDEVLTKLYTAEADQNDEIGGKYELNIANGVDADDVPYYTFTVVGPAEGGLYLSSSTNFMASGGIDYVPEIVDDKEVSAELMFDKAVREYYSDLATNDAHELRDRPKYPWRHLYDSGFTLDTKYALIDTMSVFGDVNVAAAPQDVNDDRNSLDSEYSIGTALVTRFQMHPESTEYGTPATRGLVMMQTGFLPNSTYRRMVPQLYALAMKRSMFGGAANGILKGEKAYDLATNNRVEELVNINHTFAPATMRKQIWEAGICYSQTEDQKNVFFPAIQSVTRDKTSVLLSDIVVNICCYVTSMQHNVWRQFTGNSKYTPEQIKDKAAKYYASLVPSTIFDNRVVIDIEVTQSKLQEELGYAYTPTVRIYGNNMALVFDYELETYRLTDSEVTA